MQTLTDNLTRMRPSADGAKVSTEGDGRTLYGHFSVFNTWYEVSSAWEGRFMERIAPGAFARSIAERGDTIKAQFDHGHDPWVGNSVLGPFNALTEDKSGGYYEIALIDTDYNRDRIIPQAEAGLLGASFRFSVADEVWDDSPKRSSHNPDALPERTITDTDLYELGPVVFPASLSATAGLRSTTDQFIDRLLNDPLFVARFTERTGVAIVEKMLSSLPADGRSDSTPKQAADGPGETAPIHGSDPRAVLTLAAVKRAARPRKEEP